MLVSFPPLGRSLVLILLISSVSWLFSTGAQAYDNQSLLRSLASNPGAQVQGVADVHNTQSWRGIPYAAAPKGELRWRAPRNPAVWSGARDASKFGAVCPQIASLFGVALEGRFDQVIGSEDCLFLNVWRPKSSESNLPVLFWIHGGANYMGAASDPLYNGAAFARKANAVVVSLNFRVGSLGWFYNDLMHEGNAKDDSGNFVTLDLIKGLEWVRDNIRQFGGNPDSVTIAGQSSGCINAWGLLQSPLADTLVDRMICMSGLPNAYPKSIGQLQSSDIIDDLLIDAGIVANKAEAIAYRLHNPVAVRSFLRGLPAEVIVESTPMPIVVGHFTDGYVIPWAGYADLILGGYHKVPMILGSTKDEGTVAVGRLGWFAKNDSQLWDLINYGAPGTVGVTEVIKPTLYPSYRPLHRTLSLSIDLTLDNICRYLRLLQSGVYRYNFDWDDVPSPWNEAFGAMHASDIPFLFGNFPGESQSHLTRYMITSANASQRQLLSDRFIKYVAQFMRNGDPNRWFDGLVDWPDWSNYWIFKKRLVLDNTIQANSHDFWLSDVYGAFEQLSPTERAMAEQWILDNQVRLEDAGVIYQ